MPKNEMPMAVKIIVVLIKVLFKPVLTFALAWLLCSIVHCHLDFKAAQIDYLKAATRQIEQKMEDEHNYLKVPNLPPINNLK